MKHHKGFAPLIVIVVIVAAVAVGGGVFIAKEKANTKKLIADAMKQEINNPVIIKPSSSTEDKQTSPQKLDESQPEPQSQPVKSDCSEGIPSDVNDLLKKNAIDIFRLNRITPQSDNILGYGKELSGYTFKLNRHTKDKAFDGPMDLIRLDACYKGRLVLSDILILTFINSKFSSAMDFNFSSISVDSSPRISLSEAKKIAYREQSGLQGIEPKLGYYDINATKGNVTAEYILAYEFNNGAHVIIDAHSGKVIRSFNGITY